MTTFLSGIQSVSGHKIISRALRIVNDLGEGETPSAADIAISLEALNAMIESWRNERMLIAVVTETLIPLVSGQADYTVGLTGDVLANRPIEISSAWQRINGIDTPVEIFNDERWGDIPNKTMQSSVVSSLRYRAESPDGVVDVWPVPDTAGELFIAYRSDMANFPDSATRMYLPPGVERALVWNLALEIADEFRWIPTARAIENARNAKANMKRGNRQQVESSFDASLTGGVDADWQEGF